MSNESNWERFNKYLIRWPDSGFFLDVSRMQFDDGFLQSMEAAASRAFQEMSDLEGGAIANRDEKRMVGHYWLRNPEIAPNDDLRAEITSAVEMAKNFAAKVHAGEVAAPGGGRFKHLLLIGIGGSALGPQLVEEAVTDPEPPLKVHYFDNTDPAGMDRILARIGGELDRTLAVVISKSGGTRETRNGMLEAEEAFRVAGLDFGRHAVAVTGPGSQLDDVAKDNGWIMRFPMSDWVGGRTSVMSVVGLVPATLLGVDVDAFLTGAAAMDARTRVQEIRRNPAMLLALMWWQAGGGKGRKDMVILPYCDQLVLLGKYLQQLVMESLGKELDRKGKTVNQGIAVYGNKGSTDQHAYVQQLRDGVDNFFATLIQVGQSRESASIDVEEGVRTGDYLQGFLRGTREALAGNGRQSITLGVPRMDAANLGSLIALFERAVGFYASLVDINAYHQPGVEAGKKAAGEFIGLMVKVREYLSAAGGPDRTADEIAGALQCDAESVYHCCQHLVANYVEAKCEAGETPAEDRFGWAG